MKEAHTFERILAYILDIILISIIAALITFWIPKSKEYEKAVKDQEELSSLYSEKKIESSEYIDKMYEIRYTIDKENIIESLVVVVISLGYFGALTYYNKGQTLGKKLLHTKVVSNNGKEASYLQLIGRALINNGCITSLISIILLLFIKSNQYSYTVCVVGIIQSVILITSFLMIIIRKDKKGLHDLICGTKVVHE